MLTYIFTVRILIAPEVTPALVLPLALCGVYEFIFDYGQHLHNYVPSRGSCDPAEWTALLGRWRGVPSTQRGPGSQLPLRVLEMYQIVAAGDDSTPLRSEIKL